MKKIKMLLCLGMLLILSGCSSEINLLVKTNKKITEDIVVMNDWNNLKEYNTSIESAKDAYQESYSDIFSRTPYDVKYSTDNNMVKATLTNNSYKLSTISDSVVYQKLFDKIEIEDVGNYKKYILNPSDEAIDLFMDSLGIADDPTLFFTEIPVNIQFHNVISDSNADSYDEKTNTYTWIITQNNLDRNINFTITNDKRYDIIMPYLFKKYGWILIVICVMAVIAIWIANKVKSSNEL